MKYLIYIFLVLFMSACSVQVVDMTEEPTLQKFDLTDMDRDGVVVAREQCLTSFNGEKVNNNGCGSEKLKKVRLKLEVNFDNNSFVVKAKYYRKIKGVADFLTRYPNAQVTIEGHTSKQGGRALNQKLSQNRAQAVKNILVNRFAIDEKRIKAVGYGFDRLLVEGEGEYIHARNRRIIAEISSETSLKDIKWTIYSVDQPDE